MKFMKTLIIALALFLFDGTVMATVSRYGSDFIRQAQQRNQSWMSRIAEHDVNRHLISSMARRSLSHEELQVRILAWRFADTLLELASKTEDSELKMALIDIAQPPISKWKEHRPDYSNQSDPCKTYSAFLQQVVDTSFIYGLTVIIPLNQLFVRNNILRVRAKPDELVEVLNLLAKDQSESVSREMFNLYTRSIKHELSCLESIFSRRGR